MNLITDRTSADVAAANSRGTYNAEDMNRVCEAINYLAGLYGLPVIARTDWEVNEIITPTAAAKYISDLQVIRAAAHGDVPEIPSTLDGLTYTGANDIERMLNYAEDFFNRIIKSYRYTNTIYTGATI